MIAWHYCYFNVIRPIKAFTKGQWKSIRAEKDLHSRPLPEKVRREMTRIVKHADESLVGKLGE